MQVKPEQLASRLKQETPPFIWIAGDETLLVQEACDAVRLHARSQGFSEREVLDADAQFDWNRLVAAGAELSLFAERKVIDLRASNGKLDDKARAALGEYLASPNPDYLLLLTTGKVDKAAQGTKWFRQLEGAGWFCQIWPVSEQQLPQWIRQRLAAGGIDADADAVSLLAERVEGNLLAAAQEVEKLRLLAGSGQLDGAGVAEAVADSSRYSVFTLVDACLAGNPARALKILAHLEAEGEQSLGVLARLNIELRNLATMQAEIERGHNPHAVMQSHRVWNNRTELVGGALQRHNQRTLEALLDKARVVDQAVKGLLDDRPWEVLRSLVLGFSDARLLVRVV